MSRQKQLVRRGRRKFSKKTRNQVLLWCARHCCLCGKSCGLNIEIDHIQPELASPKLNAVDNAIPVCYDCHAVLEQSRASSPRGSSFSVEEVKARREQVYEDHTRHLVPVLSYGPINDPNMAFPCVRFFIQNNDGSLQVWAQCVVDILVEGKLYGRPVGHYRGERDWICNPGLAAIGWFDLSNRSVVPRQPDYRGPAPEHALGKDVRLRVHLKIIDTFKRSHDRLPVEWYYDWTRALWVYDP